MSRLVPIGIAAFVAASLGIFFFGDSGVCAFGGLSRYEQGLQVNVEALRQRNQDLQAELDRLKNDPESVRVLARDIGMYSPGDTVVKIVGRPTKSESYAVGDLLHLRRAEPTGNAMFKQTALGVVAAVLVIALFAALASRRRANGSSRR